MAPVRAWLAAPLGQEVSGAIERLRRSPDVQQIAVMPDVHLSADVCIEELSSPRRTLSIHRRLEVTSGVECWLWPWTLSLNPWVIQESLGASWQNLAGQCQLAAETGGRSFSSPRT